MSREKLILSGVVLLGLLGVLVYEQARKDESLGKPEASSTEFPTISAPSGDIDKLSITNGEKGEVVLERVADPNASAEPHDGGADGGSGPATKWVMTKPLRAEANQTSVKDLLANLEDLKVSSQIKLTLDDTVRKDKQLDAAHAVHLIAWKGADKKVDEFFGKSGAAGELVVLNGKPDNVWAAKGYSSYLYAKEVKDFRDRTVFKLDEDKITEVDLKNANGVFAFTKDGDKWTASVGGKPLEHFDQEKAKDLVRALKSLNADDFGDGKSLAETGLDTPAAQVMIHVKDDAKVSELDFGKVSSGTNHWAKRADEDTIVQITSYVNDLVNGDTAKFQMAADAGVHDGGGPKPPALKLKK